MYVNDIIGLLRKTTIPRHVFIASHHTFTHYLTMVAMLYQVGQCKKEVMSYLVVVNAGIINIAIDETETDPFGAEIAIKFLFLFLKLHPKYEMARKAHEWLNHY
jgi:hypothetical protein